MQDTPREIQFLDENATTRHFIAELRGSIEERRKATCPTLGRRMGRWGATPIEYVRCCYTFAPLRPPVELSTSVLCTMLYGWCGRPRQSPIVVVPVA